MNEQEHLPEIIEFGGETWTKEPVKDEGSVEYRLQSRGYVYRCPAGNASAGRWLGISYVKFQNAPRIFDGMPGKIFDTQAEAMRYVLDLTSDSAITEVIEWLVTNGHLEGTNAIQAGVAAGRKQIFAEIENLKTAA